MRLQKTKLASGSSVLLALLLLLPGLAPTQPCAAQAVATAPALSTTIVRTQAGQLQGKREDDMLVFRGVAYAEAPVGAQRFRPPQPLKPWRGIRQVTAIGPKATQVSNDKLQGQEDCLALNVWAPATATPKSKKAVVVWVHGGAFTGGTGSDFPGANFAQRDDVVTVSINYRLGSLGFLYLGSALGPAYQNSGNCGLLDAVAALQWVHQNISAFGGDPARVTVMGESAGAKLVSALLVTPAAQGLFQQAILESGSVQCVRDTATAATVTRRLLQELHLAPNQAQQLLTLPPATLMQAQAKIASGPGGLQLFGPVLDGTVITTAPLTYLSRPNRAPLRVLLGTNRDEAASFMNSWPTLAQPNADVLTPLFGKNGSYVWRAYSSLSQTQPADKAWLTTVTDYLYRMATYRLAQTLVGAAQPVWLYRFDYEPSADQRPVHARELGYAWNSLPRELSANPTSQQLATLMHHHWVSFIKTGKPEAAWPAYTAADRQVMLFDATSHPTPLPSPYEDPAFPVQGFVL
ncbi:carboxylesterase/lipase family protein [Hymenobacter sp. GOD-10R]|uniref:carboxylesterase/lipase family protein n=1 Tax=Hymenobacter sp. GOD-10R TaxID=3093922 RepID=UPI002D77B9CF|nr:carboxylesterase/lipase family protein [Hymenobacter sp. GOD-10R]WRQ26563.1 carboxylesterase/lipase family protein [Hymenobacter sp. GOD-10R]